MLNTNFSTRKLEVQKRVQPENFSYGKNRQKAVVLQMEFCKTDITKIKVDLQFRLVMKNNDDIIVNSLLAPSIINDQKDHNSNIASVLKPLFATHAALGLHCNWIDIAK